jgi:hypothetical protein
MTHDTDHTVEGTREDEQVEEAEIGGGIRIVVLAYEGLGVIDPHMNGPIAQPA